MATHTKQDSVSNITACPCRTGQTIFNGTIANATILASGTGSVFLLGTNTSVTVDLAGVSNVWLRNTEGERLHTEQTHLSVFARACSEDAWLQKPGVGCCTQRRFIFLVAHGCLRHVRMGFTRGGSGCTCPT